MSLDSKALLAIIRKKPVLSGCALIGFVLLLTIYFRLGLVASAQEELDRKTDEGKKYHDNVINATQLEDQLSVVVAANRVAQEHLMHPSDLAKNLQYFYRIESETGVKYTDLKPNGAPTGNKLGLKAYIPVNYSITVQGEFPKLIDFLRRLEHGFYYYRLNTMVVTSTGATVTLALNVDFIGQL